ncbi:hypothetical protein JCM19235_431 [Vibrio maritimus]|uniref:Uncharacterized protein n=1 Tax=Vibrio maritimus TaxID=990268 RepID=A0A090S0S5_9VIBR|nr:hypothetical protein JCM19235_431 [Vibrio maritimus]
MRVMKRTIDEIICVTIMLDRSVSAIRAVNMIAVSMGI